MTDKKIPQTSVDPTTDLTETDIAEINKYIEDGLPNILSITDADMHRAASLYLEGKTYHQIGRILKTKPVIIKYLGRRGDWYIRRLRHKHDLMATMTDRIQEAQLVSQDHLLRILQHFEKKIMKIVDKHDATNADIYSLNLKEVDKYLKVIKTIHDLSMPKGAKTKVSPVGLNVGAGIVLTKKGDSVEITPSEYKEKTVEDMLADLAKGIREKDIQVPVRSEPRPVEAIEAPKEEKKES